MRPVIPDGVYFGLPEADYHAAAGLSNSGMKQLAVSPLHYWHHNLNPDAERPDETPAQRWGKAVHCRLLEPERFEGAYAAALCKDDYPDALVTVSDLQAFLTGNGVAYPAKAAKPDLIRIVANSGLPAFVWDVEKAEWESTLGDRELLTHREMAKLDALAAAVTNEPYAAALLTTGVAEVSFFVTDPETGVTLKARMDYVRPNATVDVKTFSNARGKPTDRAVFDAVHYEGYLQQAAFYQKVRELARRGLADGSLATHGDVPEVWLKSFVEADAPGFGFLFVESGPPFDLRIVQLARSEHRDGEPNVYWLHAEERISEGTRLYADCVRRYGVGPWRDPQQPRLLLDTDLPQLMFA